MYRLLRGTGEIEAMRARLASVTVDDRARWGTMSATEMMGHLRGALQMALGEMVVTAPPGLPTGGVLKVFALWLPVRWPQGVATVPELRRGAAALAGADFDGVRKELLGLYERFAQARLRTRHVMLGAMRPVDWQRWGFLHTDHHLRQFGR